MRMHLVLPHKSNVPFAAGFRLTRGGSSIAAARSPITRMIVEHPAISTQFMVFSAA
jgi:hypothetical protein